MQYQFDATVQQNAVMCGYGIRMERYAADCGPSAMASPFETLDVGQTYRGTIVLEYLDESSSDLASISCSIHGLNCDFADPRNMWGIPLASDLNTSTTRLALGNGWNTMSYFDFGVGVFSYENDWTDYSIFTASLSNVVVAPLLAAFSFGPTSTQPIPTPLPGSLTLLAIGAAALGAARHRQRR